MKYIITESQYNKAIDKFITKQFEGSEEVRIPRYGLVLWVKDGKIVAEILNVGDRGDYFFVDRDIWDSIDNMFDIDNYKEIRLGVENWLERNHNLSNLTAWRHSQHHSDWIGKETLL